MPTKDPQKRREQTRRAVAKHRRKPQGVSPGNVSPSVSPETTADGRPIRTIDWHDEHGHARATRYCAPLADWLGMGYCRDCNVAVVSGSNYCGCDVLT